MYLSNDLLHSRYKVDVVKEGFQSFKVYFVNSCPWTWQYAEERKVAVDGSTMRFHFGSVFRLLVLHSRLVGTHVTGNIKILIINCKLYFDKTWQMSHTNPKVTEVLLFRYRISFLLNSCLDTEPAGRYIILWRNINVRASIFEGSRFSPTMDSAISEHVGTGNPWSCLTALCWKSEIA